MSRKKVNLPTPSKIKHYLDEYVIGQEEAKKALSVAVYNHYKRIIHNYENKGLDGETTIDKSNIILHGATGSGKTLLVKTIAELINVPYYIQDCTKITASGYVGDDVENCLVGLLRSCNYNIEKAEMGIIVLDEVDKIAKKEAGQSITRDVSGECVQQSLLKIVEGDVVGVPPNGGRKHPEAQQLYINTNNILFIACGAFVGLDDIVKKKIGGHKIGFESDDNAMTINDKEINDYVTSDDFKKYGFIPEFVGRFPIITHVDSLSEGDLVTILKEPKNSLVKQYTALLNMDKADLMFDPEALKEIARVANLTKTGARGLRSILEIVMKDVMYETPDETVSSKKRKKIVITEKYVKEKIKVYSKFLNKAA